MKIAVLGSGITGLSAAYYLSKSFKDVFLIEGKRGGWVQSIKRKTMLETGPRSLRHSGSSGQNTLDLIYELNLQNEMAIVKKDSPAAKERYG
jgi:oxygen-dependent protoporphyrinogen oxidase